MSAIQKITKPGVYDMPAQLYHQDPVEIPSASSSLLKLMMAETPKHAWDNHPRLNPQHEEQDAEERFDRGHACHILMLNDESKFCIIDADAYRSNDAKAKRAKAYVDGLVPILKHKWPEVVAMCDAGKAQLANMETKEEREIFTGGKAEQTYVWSEVIDGQEIWCRARLDYDKGPGQIYGDYKSLAASIHPSCLHRYAEQADWAFQQAFYERGIMALTDDERPDFRFVAHEATKPHRLLLVQANPMAVEIGRRKVEYALRQWAWCMKNNIWPGFPNQTVTLGVSPWIEESFQALEYEAQEEKKAGRNEFERMRAWQAPL